MKILSILHNIFLTPDEINQLLSQQEIEVIGASLPVWFYKGNTSEPAEEVFCKYRLTNNPEYKTIKTEKNGYAINMPQIPQTYVKPERLTDEEWRELTAIEQTEWYEKNQTPVSANNLKSIDNGGAEYLHFKEHSKITKNNKAIMLIHTVEIRTTEWLKSTFS